MKLYVINKETKDKKYLNIIARSRDELKAKLNSQALIIDGETYRISEVNAEADTNTALAGGILGGALGAIAGGPGVFIGGLIGAAIGSSQIQKDKKESEEFNGSEA